MSASYRELLPTIAISLGNVGLGYDVALIGGLLANPAWFQYFQLQPGSALLGTVIAAFIFGSIVATLPATLLSDFIGRRASTIIACIINLAATIATAFSQSLNTLIALRVLSGFANGIALVNSACYVNETVCTPSRAQFTALAQTTFFVGTISSAWCAYGALYIQSSWSWRLVLILQAFWPAVQLPLLLFIPESPRWLMMRGRPERARAAVMYSIKTDQEVDRILNKIKTERSHSWSALFRSPRTLLIIYLGLATQLTGTGVTNYYLAPVLQLTGITSSLQQAGLNAGVQMCAFAVAVTSTFFVDRFGRKALLLTSLVCMLLTLSALTACSAVYVQQQREAAAIAVIVLIFGFTISYSIAWATVPPLYITELAPTDIRAKASALNTGFAGVGICINQWVNPIALSSLQWRYFLVYVGTIILTIGVVLLFAPETKGLDLEDAARLYNIPGRRHHLDHTPELRSD